MYIKVYICKCTYIHLYISDTERNVLFLFYLVLKEFRIKASTVTKTDFKTIEHLLRFGYKQVKLIQMPGFRSGFTTQEQPNK
jgi:hypothetical protein